MILKMIVLNNINIKNRTQNKVGNIIEPKIILDQTFESVFHWLFLFLLKFAGSLLRKNKQEQTK